MSKSSSICLLLGFFFQLLKNYENCLFYYLAQENDKRNTISYVIINPSYDQKLQLDDVMWVDSINIPLYLVVVFSFIDSQVTGCYDSNSIISFHQLFNQAKFAVSTTITSNWWEKVPFQPGHVKTRRTNRGRQSWYRL